jgi:hypothetical protein
MTEVLPTGNRSGALLLKFNIPQLSLTESKLKFMVSVIVAQLGIVIFASDGQTIEGTSLSFTVTVKLHETVDPPASETLYVTMVLPLLKLKGEGTLLIPLIGDAAKVAPLIVHVRVVISPSGSLVIASRPLFEALQNPGSVFVTMLSGQTMVGGAARELTVLNFGFDFLLKTLVSVYCELLINEFK